MKWVMWIDPVDMDSVHFGVQRERPMRLSKYDYIRLFSVDSDRIYDFFPEIAKELKDLRPGEVYDVEVQIRFPEDD